MKRFAFVFAFAMSILTCVAQDYFYIEKTDGTFERFLYDEVARVVFNDINDEFVTIEISDKNVKLYLGESFQLSVATIPEEKAASVVWRSADDTIANVDENGLVQALAYGTTYIIAQVGNKADTCVLNVVGNPLAEYQIWPVILDGRMAETAASNIVASFIPDEIGNFLYVWEGTYTANDNPSGRNFYGNNDGYLSLIVGSAGWSGAGFCLTEYGTTWQDAEALRQAIVADPDSYFLHLAIKSTDNYSHCFSIMGMEATQFVLGSNSVYDGPVYADFPRDGEWYEFDIPMSAYASALATMTCTAGVNVFYFLSEGRTGAQLNLDAVYFYKK